MKILFVGMSHSIHTVRWITQLKNLGWEIHFCASTSDYRIHNELTGIIYHYRKFELPINRPENKYVGHFLNFIPEIKQPILSKIVRNICEIIGLTKTRAELLEVVIKKIQPDIVHTLETQSSGYLINSVQKRIPTRFPFWMHSNWGIDLHYCGRLRKHIDPIKETLSKIDVLIVEGKRDEFLAQQFGYDGPVYTFPSVGGGFIIPEEPLTPTNNRNIILIKGTQDECRRGLVAMRGLARCADIVGAYQIMLYTSNEATRVAAELFEHQTGQEIKIIDEISHKEMLALNGRALISICVNLSDGLPNAMLEAMLMGAFPIQSDTSLADEWITNGENGILVSAEDPEDVELAIRHVFKNLDQLQSISEYNRKLIAERLEYNKTQSEVIEMYKEIIIRAHTTHINL